MRQELASLGKAWQLWQSPNRGESVVAVVLVAAVVAPFVLQARRRRRRSSGRRMQFSGVEEFGS